MVLLTTIHWKVLCGPKMVLVWHPCKQPFWNLKVYRQIMRGLFSIRFPKHSPFCHWSGWTESPTLKLTPLAETVGLIYETNVRPKFGRTVVSTQNLEFINMDVSGGYDQISRQVWARVRKFLSQPELACSTENFKELYKWQHFVHLDYFPKPTNKAFFFFFLSGL